MQQKKQHIFCLTGADDNHIILIMVINKGDKRNTMQKELTLDAVRSFDGHPSVEDVYGIVSHRYNAISKATVYRNLASLCDEGLIGRISGCDGRGVRYDCNTEPHAHTVCMKCGDVADVMDSSLMKEISRKADNMRDSGFSVISHELIFEGICPGCREKEKEKWN